MNPADYPFVRTPENQGAIASDIDVNLDEGFGLPQMHDGAMLRDLPDGSVEVDFSGGAGDGKDPASAGFQDNLAEYIASETVLSKIGMDVCEAVGKDLQSRSEWLQRFRKGMELLGVVEPSGNLGVLKHAKEISHPLIVEAIVQYQARAVAEAFPPEGPVKGVVMGKKTPEREEQAERVSGYMNYQLMVEDETFFLEADQGYFLLGMEGSIFKKVYRDEINGMNVSRLVMGRDFIVPYTATSLQTALRYTHVLPYSQNDVRKLQARGFYRHCTLDMPTGDPAEGHEAAVQAQDTLEGKTPETDIEEDRPHLVYEQHCELDLEGFEDVGEDKKPSGIKLPYIVHVDRDTEKVLAIFRNWREDDVLKRKRVRFAHYKYLPGPGFYGLGLVHIIGGLGAAATGILRLLLVTAAFAGSGGGFKTKDSKLGSNIELEPGVFKDVDHTAEELKNSFYQPDFKQPPEALFKVLGLVTEAGKSFASNTEAMTGEGPATGPVGTMVALIEQGSKVYSGIHKRSHMAAGVEYKLLAELNGEYLPDEGYPYDVPGEERIVYAQDFSKAVDVVPVSDPNIYSSTQRIAIAQAVLEVAEKHPDKVNLDEAVKRMFAALRVPDADQMLIDATKVERADAVSENAMLMLGRPVRAYPDQDHASHMAVVKAVIEDKNVDQRVRAAAMGHYNEHMALQWMTEASQAMGLPTLPLNLEAQPGEPVAAQLRPESDAVISQRAAAIINKLRPPQQDPENQKVEGELALKEKRQQGELKIMAAREKGKMQLEAARAKWEIALKRQIAFAELALKRELDIKGLSQDGQHEQARMQQDQLNTERAEVDGAVKSTGAELEAAIKALAEGMDALSAQLQQAGGAVGQPA